MKIFNLRTYDNTRKPSIMIKIKGLNNLGNNENVQNF